MDMASLDTRARYHERRALELSEVGDGSRAAYETNRAVSYREAMQRKAEEPTGWWHREVLLR
jgi:hypothetical protein